MKTKIFILFLLVFAAIGQTVFLNIDAKSNFLEEDKQEIKSSYATSKESETDFETSEVVVTIRQHDAEETSNFVNTGLDVEADSEEESVKAKKPCNQTTEKERLFCQKAKEAAKQKQMRVSGSNPLKNSTIQTPMP